MLEHGAVVVSHERIVQVIERWGTPFFSIALLNPINSIFAVSGFEGLICYRKIGNCVVVFGGPVCPAHELAELMHAFHAFIARESNNLIYIAASAQVRALAERYNYVHGVLQAASEIVLNPLENPLMRSGRKASYLRNKYNQCIKQAITITEYYGGDQALENNLEALRIDWVQSRKGPQIYLYAESLFDNRTNKRWFYAEHNNTIIGVVVLNKIGAPAGWLLNILIVKQDALSAVSEFMLMHVLEVLRTEQCTYFSTGPLPDNQLIDVHGFGKITGFLAPKIYSGVCKVFYLSNRQRYWEKFHPHKNPSFFLFSKAKIGMQEVVALMKAMNASM